MHGKFLFAALEEGMRGQGLCAPNPAVGAVAVKNGQIIASAFHRGAGTPHAEQLVIDQLPVNETGITLYVTLEPCNHYGRTPPCVEAIINYGFQHVVFAYCDPNPLVSKNNTPNRLKASGIEALHYPLPEIDFFYQGYRHWTMTGKPWVTAKIAQTFDGKIAGFGGERVALSNLACEHFTHENRLKSDIILTTAKTVNQDNPQFTVRLPNLTCSKPVAIIDSRLMLNQAATVLSTATHCHIFYDEESPEPACRKNRTYHSTPSENGLLSLERVIQSLGDLGYHHVWVEAGGGLFSSLHRAHLVQRTYCYLVPDVLGERAVSAYQEANMFNRAKRVVWQEMGDNMIAILDWE
jgi:diaminohydroxyphosphoribosylaminopyrimidine deaminase/5-amino-6-(5-phosphoribosylamino)uracil reductase